MSNKKEQVKEALTTKAKEEGTAFVKGCCERHQSQRCSEQPVRDQTRQHQTDSTKTKTAPVQDFAEEQNAEPAEKKKELRLLYEPNRSVNRHPYSPANKTRGEGRRDFQSVRD